MHFMVENKALKETNSQPKTAIFEGNNCSTSVASSEPGNEALIGSICPNCGARLDGRKCKLLCPTVGCGYMVTCSEW